MRYHERSRRRAALRPALSLVLPLMILLASAASCGGGAMIDEPAPVTLPPDDPSDDAELPLTRTIEPATLTLATYDGSGEAVHPDAVFFPDQWNGRRYWFAVTPYPGGDPAYENPSIYAGSRERDWAIPAGLTNPLARPDRSGYLSDPDLSYDPAANELRLYYRQTVGSDDILYLMRSTDGERWSAAVQVLSAIRYSLISPAILREDDGSWRMFTVNAGMNGCRAAGNELALQQRQSPDGVHWSAPQAVDLKIPGQVPWHWDVQYVAAKRQYWALVAAYPDGQACSATAVWFATSENGTTWKSSPTPLLAPGWNAAMHDVVYRSTFRYHASSNAVSVWFSGARYDHAKYNWSVASARYTLAELYQRVGEPGGTTAQRDVRPAPRSAVDRAAIDAFVKRFP
jgi:hypothetical protein